MLLGQLFSQRVGYAIHALCYMARTSPRQAMTTVPELSHWMRTAWPGSSETYLANVIRRLVRGGILMSQRGISGGYCFARGPEEITLRDVVALLEAGDVLVDCSADASVCERADTCITRFLWKEAALAMFEKLNSYTLGDLAAMSGPKDEIRK
jgi:Rrf2 family protein